MRVCVFSPPAHLQHCLALSLSFFVCLSASLSIKKPTLHPEFPNVSLITCFWVVDLLMCGSLSILMCAFWTASFFQHVCLYFYNSLSIFVYLHVYLLLSPSICFCVFLHGFLPVILLYMPGCLYLPLSFSSPPLLACVSPILPVTSLSVWCVCFHYVYLPVNLCSCLFLIYMFML